MLNQIGQNRSLFIIITLSILFAGIILIFKLEAFLGFLSNPDAPFYTSVYILIYESGNALLGLGYLFLILLITQTGTGMKMLSPFKYAGRMALTNYLMQSVIFTTIFYGYGFGLFAQVNPSRFLLWGLIVFVVQIILSRLILSKFRYGPMEWIWRRMTYGKWF